MGHLDVLAQGVLEKRAGEKGLAWRVEANYREPGMLVNILKSETLTKLKMLER